METKLARALAALVLVGCGSTRIDPGTQNGASTPGDTNDGRSDAGAATVTTPVAWDGKGFVVHEWGTNTVVVGTDGSMQRGLHHEEEDLPAFVYDRMKQGEVSVDVKMETPVTYFYADAPRTVSVAVQFPKGLFSQWFPKVRGFQPMLAEHEGKLADPFMDPTFPYTSAACRTDSLTPKNGLLDWGDVQILARGETVATPDAPLDRYTWSHARAVAANAVRVAGESEKFLFYRGLGNLPMGVKITAMPDKRDLTPLQLENTDPAHAVGTVFVVNVDGAMAKFVEYRDGIAAGGKKVVDVNDKQYQPIDAYVTALADAMTAALVREGLFTDEARAMVATWSRQWFRTPGERVLYLAPQAWTDAQIPLAISPKPDRTVRVMVIRNEVLTVGDESIDEIALGKFASDPTAARAHFLGLGRFAEPRLRRAIQRKGSTPEGAAALLATLEGPDVLADSK